MEECKHCPKCDVWKARSEFAKDRSTSDGLEYVCKQCRRTAALARSAHATPPEAKRCAVCKEWLPASGFDKARRNRDGLSTKCKSCRQSYLRQYYKDHREDLKKRAGDNYHANIDTRREQHRTYRRHHPDETIARNRAYRQKNHGSIIKWKRQYYITNKPRLLEEQRIYRTTEEYREQQIARRGTNVEQKRAWGRASYWRNVEERRAKGRLRRQAHREQTNFYSRRYKARRRGAFGSFTLAEWQAMCTHFGNVCLACGVTATLTIDHVVPVSMGGSNLISNLQPLCGPCNSSKQAKFIDYRDPDQLAQLLSSLT